MCKMVFIFFTLFKVQQILTHTILNHCTEHPKSFCFTQVCKAMLHYSMETFSTYSIHCLLHSIDKTISRVFKNTFHKHAANTVLLNWMRMSIQIIILSVQCYIQCIPNNTYSLKGYEMCYENLSKVNNHPGDYYYSLDFFSFYFFFSFLNRFLPVQRGPLTDAKSRLQVPIPHMVYMVDSLPISIWLSSCISHV